MLQHIGSHHKFAEIKAAVQDVKEEVLEAADNASIKHLLDDQAIDEYFGNLDVMNQEDQIL